MKLKSIQNKLPNQTFRVPASADSSTDIYMVSYLDSKADFSPNCIYITTMESCAFKDLPSDLIVCTVPTRKELDKVYRSIQECLIQEQILVDKKARLIEVFYSNHCMQDLIDEAYNALDNPIMLVDTNYKILASCQNTIYDRPDLQEQSVLGYMTDQNIQAMKKDRVYETARERGYPFYNKAEDAKYGWVTALINVHGIESAQMGVMECNHAITDMDLELIDFLCRLVSLELQKSDFYRVNQSLMHSVFLSELLDNRIRDINTIKHRIQTLSWSVTENLCIMTISEQRADIFDKKAQLISKQLHLILPDNRWVIYDGKIVFLICLQNTSQAMFQDGTELVRYLKINNLTASISRCFHSFLDVRKFYEESLTAYTIGQRFDSQKHLYNYTDYMCQHIGTIVSEHNKLSDFYHPVVSEIREYDSKHKTSLLLTLKEYLTHPDNPTLVAENLYIHKNTLFYRMNKLKELFGIDLGNGEERLKIHLTLKFMDLE